MGTPRPMTDSPDISLFSERLDTGQRPTSFIASIGVHAVAISLVWFSFAYKPPVIKIVAEHFTVRQLDLHMPDPLQRPSKKNPAYPSRHSDDTATASKAAPKLPVLRLATHAITGPQTLIQPELANNIKLPQPIPVPQVMIWSPSKVVVKKIVPPTPDKPATADVKPSLERPNQEIPLADVNIASSNLPSVKLHMMASTTSPISVHQPDAVPMPPATASQQSAPPTPAAILSLSDMRMKDGTAVLPPANQSAAKDSEGVIAPGPVEKPSSNGGAGKPGDAGAGKNGTSASASKPDTASAGTDAMLDTTDAGRPRTTPIALPKDGHFGAVIVGDSLTHQFPEVADVWNGRLAYTAYLHVGLQKSWILQYSLPPNAEVSAGGIRLEAPWPYSIVRPNLAPGSIDADALMVHGFVDASGRFEGLSIVVPEAFAEARFVIAALEQWQFRPATQNGQNAKVEVLLIIPDEME